MSVKGLSTSIDALIALRHAANPEALKKSKTRPCALSWAVWLATAWERSGLR